MKLLPALTAVSSVPTRRRATVCPTPPGTARPIALAILCALLAPVVTAGATTMGIATTGVATGIATTAATGAATTAATGIATTGVATGIATSLTPEVRARMNGALLDRLDAATADEFVPVILSVDPPFDVEAVEHEIESRRIRTRWQRHRLVLERAREHAERTQPALLAALEAEAATGDVGDIRPFWVTNAIACRIRPGALSRLLSSDSVVTRDAGSSPRGLRSDGSWGTSDDPSGGGDPIRSDRDRRAGARPGISRAQLDSPVFLKDATQEVGFGSPTPSGEPGANMIAIHADQAWARGLTGAGRLVAHFDAGAEGDHVSFGDRWRGAQPGVPWQEAWFDPYTDTEFPYGTDGGHGTGTLSVIVGTRPDGPPLGVAYEAEWIAAGVVLLPRIDVSKILAAFEWTADPDGDPSTVDDVPDVANHSWGTDDDCSTEYWDAIDLLEAAGVVNVIAVNNSGPAAASVDSPESRATSPYENFGIGGVNTNEAGYPVRATSGRGPSPCDGVSIKPELVGPGTAVPGAGPNDNVGVFWSGTSFAAPHISGVVTLLRQLDPSLTVREIKHVLLVTAQDLDAAGEDNNTGWGLVDAIDAIEYVERNISTRPPPFVAVGPTGPTPVALLRWAPPRYLGRGDVPELTSYRIYRTAPDTPFGEDPLVEVDAFPTEFWDREVTTPQRYMVTAVYPGGEESEPTVPIEIEVVPGLAGDPSSPSDGDPADDPSSPSDPTHPGPGDGIPADHGTPAFGLRIAPSPFRGITEMRFELPSAGVVQLEVWDSSGRRVRSLVGEDLPAGEHSVTWEGRDDDGDPLPAGLYFVRLSGPGDESFTLRVARLR